MLYIYIYTHCRIKEACPVNQKCQTSSLIYQATVTRHDNNKEESYIGLTDNTFKTRYNGHTSSFRNEQYRNATTLSNYIWTLKDKNINYSLKWKIIDRERAYQPSGKNCGLCDLEKFYIISRPELASLNQRNELATSCRGLLGTLLLCDSCNCLSYFLCCCLCSILFCCGLI